MKFRNYIVSSLLSHILLISIFIAYLPEIHTEALVPAFDVDIVGPLIEEQDTVTKKIKIPVETILPVPKKSKEEELSPETIFESGTDSRRAVPGKEETAGIAPLKDKEGDLPEGSKDITSDSEYFLFDKETIEKYAKKEPAGEKDLTFDVPEFHHRGYMRMLRSKIESIWRYPSGAAKHGISGDLYIRFSIKRNGKLGKVELIRTSGHKDLDKAAMTALKEGEPFWPLPDDWKENELTINGHFIYIIGKFYIM